MKIPIERTKRKEISRLPGRLISAPTVIAWPPLQPCANFAEQGSWSPCPGKYVTHLAGVHFRENKLVVGSRCWRVRPVKTRILGGNPCFRDVGIFRFFVWSPRLFAASPVGSTDVVRCCPELINEVIPQHRWMNQSDVHRTATGNKTYEPVKPIDPECCCDPPKRVIFIQRSVWHESQRTATGGGDGLSVLAKPKDAAQQ